MPVRYLSLGEVVELHRLVTVQAGGAAGVRDLGALESAVAQPRAVFGAADLFPSLAEKGAAVCYSPRAQPPVRRRQQARGPRGVGDVPPPRRA